MPRRNVTTNERIEAYFEEHQELNASQLFRDMMDEYIRCGVQSKAVREAKRKALEAKIDALEAELEANREALRELKGLSGDELEGETEIPERVDYELQKLENLPVDKRTTGNPAIQTRAAEANISPDEFLALLGEHYPKSNLAGGESG